MTIPTILTLLPAKTPRTTIFQVRIDLMRERMDAWASQTGCNGNQAVENDVGSCLAVALHSNMKWIDVNGLAITCQVCVVYCMSPFSELTSLHRFDVISIGPFFKFRTMILEYSYQPLWVVASLWFHAFQCSVFSVEDFDSSPPLGGTLLEHLEQVTPELLVPKTRMWQMREKSCRWHLVTTNFNLWYILLL